MALRILSLAALVAAGALALAACSKQVDGTSNAPVSPGTGNPTEVVRPAMPDSPPGGPSPAGTTGAGSAQTAQPGAGLGGGLGSSSAMGSSPAGTTTGAPVGSGSTNATTGSAVGQRP